jgi:hypothetical protein
VGDFIYLKVSPTKGVQRFGIKGKLAPCYIGPYEIIEACGPVAYKLKLPPRMSAICDVFHVSQLKRCVRLPTEIIAEPELEIVVEPPELFQLKCLSHASGAATHLNRNNPSVPQI